MNERTTNSEFNKLLETYEKLAEALREENPNVNEIVRRFQTDEEDFQDLEEIIYIKLINNTIEDLDVCVNSILDEIN